ncbi:FAD-binding oxidoreductase [Actinomadura barringtoniae]|uniref:FAD-binding oxidoreductase n=1 Tax=Actinomadura barringtoniae TaxID=1427535 RepID=A0A939PDD7_9ACTN|nr:FAD-binding oxidoreductase [Actinomadura barringtoniae]MBO2450283.1 FAD-binding oxidoreductase [Actinomadura barringtoniae]
MKRRALLKATALTATAIGPLAAACSSGDDDGGGGGNGNSGPKPGGTSASPPKAITAADWNALGRGLEGKLIRPGDASYERAHRLYIPRFDRIKPAAIAYCAHPEDVAECVRFAAARHAPVAVRCGGHGYAGWSTGTGLVIDVSAMSTVTATGGRAVVGSGTRLIDLYSKLADRGLAVPAGTCPTVGVSGLTLGGGIGVTSRAYGLTCDVLESAKVVTADGKILTCDANQNSDLFWACRGGGGGNFGVAAEFTYRTHPAESLTTLFLRWPWAQAATVIRGWQRWLASAPDSIWTSVHLDTEPADGVPQVQVVGAAVQDPSGDLNRLYAAIGTNPVGEQVRLHSYMDAMQLMAGCSGQTIGQCHGQGGLPGQAPDGRFPRTEYAGKSHIALRPLPDAAIAAMTTRMVRGNSVKNRSVAMDALGGAIGRVGPGATAFPHRSGLFCMQYLENGLDHTWLRDLHGTMDQYVGGAAYVNYIDPELKDWSRAYYGDNRERLAKVKGTYDPGRLFTFPQAVS